MTSPATFTESVIEEVALNVLRKLLNGEVAARAATEVRSRALPTVGWTAPCTI